MGAGNYMKRIRKDVLPWVKDWSDPQDQIRESNDVKGMSTYDWFFCHPSAYKVIYYGVPGCLIFNFLIGLWLGYVFDMIILKVFSVVIILTSAYNLIKKIRERDTLPDTTFYDLWFREYDVMEVK